MDQRNAGQSACRLEAGDPWAPYAADQLEVIDHLGVDRFPAVFGCLPSTSPFLLQTCSPHTRSQSSQPSFSG